MLLEDLLEAIETLLRAGFSFADALWIVIVAADPLEHARHLAALR